LLTVYFAFNTWINVESRIYHRVWRWLSVKGRLDRKMNITQVKGRVYRTELNKDGIKFSSSTIYVSRRMHRRV
jgi:hypothetical protein